MAAPQVLCTIPEEYVIGFTRGFYNANQIAKKIKAFPPYVRETLKALGVKQLVDTQERNQLIFEMMRQGKSPEEVQERFLMSPGTLFSVINGHFPYKVLNEDGQTKLVPCEEFGSRQFLENRRVKQERREDAEKIRQERKQARELKKAVDEERRRKLAKAYEILEELKRQKRARWTDRLKAAVKLNSQRKIKKYFSEKFKAQEREIKPPCHR